MRIGHSFSIRCGLVLAAAILLPALSLCAQTTNLYVGSRWDLLDVKKVMAAAAEITPEKYPDSDDATVEQKSVRVYQTNGTAECQDETFVKVLTEKGKRNDRTISLSFMRPYSEIAVTKLEVIKPDGTTIPVNVAANSKESIDQSQMAENIYDPNMRVLQVNIPTLNVGDVIHSVIRETIVRPIIPNEYSEENIFEGEGYIRHITYEIYAPAERPLKKIALRDEVPGTVTFSTHREDDHTIVYRWEVNKVPRMYDEPDMPPYEMVLQRLFVSTIPDWAAVSKWYWNLSLPHLEATTPAMKQEVQKLIAGAKTEREKIKALFYFVSGKIRYMGITPEKDRPGFEPHDVDITFNKKYGVCRDKAALLVSLLRIAGLKAYPVLVSVGTRKDKEVPDPDFNHAIVAVELADGKIVLMDPTDDHTRELLPAYDRHQSYLVCRPDGATIELSPIQPPEENMMRVNTTGTLSVDGVVHATSELSFQGVNDDAYRNAFSQMKPDDIRRFFEQRLQQALPGAHLESYEMEPSDLTDMATGLRAQLKFSVDGMTANGGGKSVVSIPWIGQRLGVVNFILGGTGLDKRKYPLETQVTCGLQEDLSLKLANGYGDVLSLPSSVSVDDKSISYEQHFAYEDHSIDGSRTLKLKVVEFSPAQYLNLKQVLKTVQENERKVPIVALAHPGNVEASIHNFPEPPPTSDAQILEDHKELDVTGPHSAVYRVKFSKRILTYNGKIQDSQVKIPYNPACAQARLIHAVVISASGTRQEISPDEINLMDQGWNASAKRYTGGKILVASLPGVEIGSTIEVEYEITFTNAPFLSGFEAFQFPDELEHKSFTLKAPFDFKIHRLVSGRSGIVHESDESTPEEQKFQWQAENVGPLPTEGELPPDWTYAASVGYYVGSMSDYLDELNQMLLERARHSTRAAAVAKQLTADATNRIEAVKDIRDYVAKNIRLAGPSFTELPLSELSDADTTLADGYGHTADRAILLYAMLKAAGFQPEIVLASGLPPIAGITNVTTVFPLPQSFQIPLVRVTLDGVDYYLNDTDQYAKLGSTGYDDEMGIVLASQKCEVIHAAKGCENKVKTDYTVLLDDSGRTMLRISRWYYGQNYDAMKQYFSELPPEERERYFQRAVSAVAQGAQPLGGLTTKFDTYPGNEQFTVMIDHYGVATGKYFYFDLPFVPTLITAGANQRSLPFYVSQKFQSTVKTEIDLPSGFQQMLVVPKTGDFNLPGGESAHITSEKTANGYVITDQFEVQPTIMTPDDYQNLLQIESDLGRKSSRIFLLEQK